MSVMRAPGTVEPVIYFEDKHGFLLLAPYSDFPTPEGQTRCGAGTLAEIDRLQKRLEDQERRKLEQEGEHAEKMFAQKREEVRDRLYQRLTSAGTSEYEKEFIRLYLQLRQEKREKHRKRFLLDQTVSFHFHARENDLHGRDAGKEEWKD